MRDIVLAAARHDKSSRGAPLLRRTPLTLHSAVRLAAPTTNMNSRRLPVAPCADSMQHGPVLDLSEHSTTFPRLAAASCRRLWRLHPVFGLAGAHAGPD